MKKFYLVIIIALISFSNVKAWDTTAAKMYPLQVGNIYVYEKQQLWGQSCIPTIIEGRFMTRIIADTILNGKKYFVYSGWLHAPWWKYQRIDSASMNVYIYNIPNSTEYLLDSLLAGTGDSLDGCRGTLAGPRSHVQNIATANIFGQSRKIMNLDVWEGFPSVSSYQLIEGIGFSQYYGCELGGVQYTLTGCVINGVTYGDTTLTSLTPISSEIPGKYILNQNYPNPFNPSTNISFDIPKSSFVELKMYDISGKEIATLLSETLAPGSYSHKLNVGELPSGVYFYRIIAGDFISTKKMLLIK